MRRLVAALLLTIAALPAAAQAWPIRPVRLIVPYAPGGSTDNATRAFTDKLSHALGQQFVIDNKGGAAGAIGLEAGARSAPDGYTFVIVPVSTVAVLPHGRKTAYDPFKDFTYVGRFAYGALTFAVQPGMAADDIPGFVALARANPGTYFYASASIGSLPHFAAEAFKELTKVDIVHVPYRGGGEAMADFLAGNVHVVLESSVLPTVKAGKAKLLAVIDTERHPDFPAVPTMAEILPGYDVASWFGVAGPAGVAPEIVARLSQELNAVAVMPDVRSRLLPVGLRPVTDSPAAMAAAVRKEHARYGELVRKLEIKLD